jgi:hypothetical protein
MPHDSRRDGRSGEEVNRAVAEGRFFRSHEGYVTAGGHIDWPGGVTPTEPTHGGVLVDDYARAHCSACGWAGNPHPADEEGRAKARAEADEHRRLGNARREPGDFISEKDHPDNWTGDA